MTDDALYRDFIEAVPGRRGGRPCLKDTRIAVADVLGWLAAGMSPAEIEDDFPEVTPAHIRACLAFAADRERRVSVLAA